MLRVHQLTLGLDEVKDGIDQALLRRLCAKRLNVREKEIAHIKLQKRSVDARRGTVRFTLAADVILQSEGQEKAVAKRFKPNELIFLPARSFPEEKTVLHLPLAPWTGDRPIVVGAGPAGLFCALALAVRGARPILIERGQSVEKRAVDIDRLCQNGTLDAESNVLFGEGGAGAFSDGKLTCGLSDPLIRVILNTLHFCGAPEEILTSARPHIGTDELRIVLANARHELEKLGAEIRFGCRMDKVLIEGGGVRGITVTDTDGTHEMNCTQLFVCIGHSARDTYEMLCSLGLPMERKPFAVGVRIEHRQAWINRAQYGASAGHSALPPADYKLNTQTPDERGVYTFCMCPGGQVINASSEGGGVNVNGMSYHARNGINANAALLVGVRPEDLGAEDALAGVRFQRQMEQAAFALTGSLKAPATRVEDFLKKRASVSFGEVQPTYQPAVIAADVSACLPAFVAENLRYALPKLGERLRGFDHPDALLTAPETRSSAPLRILRDQTRQSTVRGLYPLGEGAGYAGGIVSAALDGMKAGMEAKTQGGQNP